MDRNRAEFWVFPKVSSVASVLQAGRSLLKLLAKALSIWKNIHLLATAVSDCFDTFLLKLGSEHLKDWQPWIENAEYKLVKIFIFHVAFAERTFTDTVMANQDGIGNQLLHQRPDLVRRAWVPVLVGIFFPLFYDLHLLRWYIQTGQAFSRPKATRFGGARPYRFSLLLFQKSHSASKGCPKIPILQFCWKLVQKLKLFLKVGRVQVAQVHWVQRAKGLRLPGFQDLIIRNKFWEEQGS